MATLQERLEQLIRLEGQALGVLRTIQDTVAGIAANVKGSGGGGAPKEAKQKSVFDQLKGGIGKVAAVLAVIGLIVGALTAVPLAIESIVKTATHFVRALNPSLVEAYETQLENLTATIGFGFTPIIAYATRSVKEWAGILLPGIQALRPIVDELSHSISGAASGAIRILARVIEGVAAVAARLVPFWTKNIDSLGAFFEVLASVQDVLNSVVTGLGILVDLEDALSTGIRAFVIALAVASAKLLGAFGGADALAKFRASLAKTIEDRKNPASGLTAAPKDTGISSFEDIAKKMAQSAFAATAGPETKPPDVAVLEDILAEIKDIEPQSWRDMIREAVRDGVKQAANPLAGIKLSDAISGESASTGGPSRAQQVFNRSLDITGALINPGGTLAGLF